MSRLKLPISTIISSPFWSSVPYSSRHEVEEGARYIRLPDALSLVFDRGSTPALGPDYQRSRRLVCQVGKCREFHENSRALPRWEVVQMYYEFVEAALFDSGRVLA